VYLSSISIYDTSGKDRVIDESTPPNPDFLAINPYGRAKVESEKALVALHQPGVFDVVILRPGIVVGAGSDPCHRGIANWLSRSSVTHWTDGTDALPLVLVEDVADAIVLAATAAKVQTSYNLMSATTITARDYVEALSDASGNPIAQQNAAPALSFVTAAGKWALKRVAKAETGRPMLREGAMRSFQARFDNSRAKQDLNWTPTEDDHVLLKRGIRDPGILWSTGREPSSGPSQA
jgi:nucleoside-diphosphate-sugar epimerase